MGIFGQIKEKILGYIDVQLKLIKLNFIAKTSNVLSYIIFMSICLFIGFCILIFTGMGLAEVFIDAGLARFLAYFSVLGVYLLILFLFLAFRKRIISFFANGFIKAMTEDDNKG